MQEQVKIREVIMLYKDSHTDSDVTMTIKETEETNVSLVKRTNWIHSLLTSDDLSYFVPTFASVLSHISSLLRTFKLVNMVAEKPWRLTRIAWYEHLGKSLLSLPPGWAVILTQGYPKIYWYISLTTHLYPAIYELM